MKKLSLNDGVACLVVDKETREYFCEVELDEGYLVITKDRSVCFTDARYYSGVKEQLEKNGIECRLLKGELDVIEYLRKENIEELLIDYDKISAREYLKYLSKDLCIKDGKELLDGVKSIKSEREIELIKKACSIVQEAYYQAISLVKKGMTELELKDILEKAMIDRGASETSFSTIVAFGKNGAVPHHRTGDTKLGDNMPILIDAGAVYKGYCSDITRTAYYGTPSKKFLFCYEQVKIAGETAIEKISDGTKTSVADGYARDVLSKNHLDQYFTHSLGHGIGREVHEFPTLSIRRHDALKNGMVFSIEPGVYIDGEFGIRIEDTVVLENGRVKRLFTDDKKLLIINSLDGEK